MRLTIKYYICLLLCLPVSLHAQHVVYAESLHSNASSHYQLIGKSANFYWVEKLQRQKSNDRHLAAKQFIQSFGLLDAKLNLLTEYPAIRIPGIIKQWLVCGNTGLDQIMITSSAGKTKILCSHFQEDGFTYAQPRLIDSLPFSAGASSLILVRSEDQSKILLVAFENSDTELTRVHTLLFNEDWSAVYHQAVISEQFSQPCIQDDEIGFPAESFDNLPIKLANNGEWLMAYPSRISHNFCIFHACANGSDYYFREILVSPFYKMEDLAMSIDNKREEMSVGMLSAYSNTSLKNVQICKYSMRQGKFEFDSSFHFNTQYRDLGSKNLSHKSFIAVPGAGYMFLIEYGTPHEFDKPAVPAFSNWEAAYLLANYTEMKSNKEPLENGYTLNTGLSPIHKVRNRGDLNLFYFPAISKDSAWSGILDMEQHEDSNNPDLSYLLVPAGNNLYMIYNHFGGFTDALATATTLNIHGQANDAPFVFWGTDKTLNFQKAHRFSADEIAVPFLDNQPGGFAIIRLY